LINPIPKAEWLRFLRFGLVGGINTLVFILIVASLNVFLSIPQTLANLVAFAVANAFAYVLHSRITFRTKIMFVTYWRFTFGASATAITVVLCGLVGDVYSVDYRIVLILTNLMIPIVNFLVMRFWVWRGNRGSDRAEGT
jgi:putative flippase GtrA